MFMTCELCEQTGGEVLWRDARCRVVYVDEPGYVGYCRVIWNAHISEMTELAETDRRHCMRIVLAVEATLRELLAPDKINLASLGNVTPHLHWHVVPRFRDDPHFPNAVWGPPLRAARGTGAERPVAGLKSALAAWLGPTSPEP
ncbi:MAG TPA: HIT family protein [Burkholderiales bacterium]|nr:HIT family protein [Burkholderiales bacterium]